MSSKIDWLFGGEVWNPIVGCTHASEGCRNCYAERLAGRSHLSGPGRKFERAIKTRPDGSRAWSGEVYLDPRYLEIPLRWQRPRLIFVNSMADLFHEQLSFGDIASVFGVMAAARQHILIILTKRAERMAGWFSEHRPDQFPPHVSCAAHADVRLEGTARPVKRIVDSRISPDDPWPLPNVWLGVSVEDQSNADHRIPFLLDTPAAVRIVSYEPALGPVDFTPWLKPVCNGCGAVLDEYSPEWRFTAPGWEHKCPGVYAGAGHCDARPALDGIFSGGESGDNARPSHPAWFRSLRDQCAAANVPLFHKQIGEWLDQETFLAMGTKDFFPEVATVWQDGRNLIGSVSYKDLFLNGDGQCMRRVGKRRAGHLIDGVAHRQMPAAYYHWQERSKNNNV